MSKIDDFKNVIFSKDITKLFKIRINTLIGLQQSINPPSNVINEYIKCPLHKDIDTRLSDLFINVSVVSENQEFYSAVQTKYIAQDSREKRWKKWIEFPIEIRELNRDTWVNFTIYDSFSPLRRKVLGGTSVKIFDKKGFMSTGSKRLKVWKNKCGNGRKTLGEIGVLGSSNQSKIDLEEDEIDEITRIETILEKTSKKFILNWVDKKFWKKYTKTIQKNSKQMEGSTVKLYVDFQPFDNAVIFKKDDSINVKTHSALEDTFERINRMEEERYVYHKHTKNYPKRENVFLFQSENVHSSVICDNDYMRDLPSALMYNHFMMSGELTNDSKNIEPTKEQLLKLSKIFKKSWLDKWTQNEKWLIWRCRYWIKKKKIKSGIVKVLYSSNWSVEEIREETLRCIMSWNEYEVNCDMSCIHDALEMLSKRFLDFFYWTLGDKKKKIFPIRKYAVKMLNKLFKMSEEKKRIMNVLLQLVQTLKYEQDMAESDLAKFLIKCSQFDFKIASKMYWYMSVEVDGSIEKQIQNGYKKVRVKLLESLSKEFQKEIQKQKDLFITLTAIRKQVKLSNRSRKGKIKLLSELIKKIDWKDIFPLKMPLDVNVTVKGIDYKKVNIFTSAAEPVKVPFITSNGKRYVTLFKEGDDLRQDQLIVQLIKVINEIFLKNAIDCKLTPYKVLACNTDGGFVEFIAPNTPVNKIYSDNNITIREYLKSKSRNIERYKKAINNYMKSMAGYTVITYLLGIGDRHLDNILLKPDGRLFHIDFGYILGACPPKDRYLNIELKLNKEMVEGLGGTDSDMYNHFLSTCVNCYNVLRKYYPLLLNMFLLMIESGIKDVHQTAIEKMQLKFQISLSDKEAAEFMREVIRRNAFALYGRVVDLFHNVGQKMKKMK